MIKSRVPAKVNATTASKRKLNQPRKAARLAAGLERLAASYGLAATAAGVGLAAMAGSAGAEIVYTPSNTPINGSVVLDLNNDGLGDFLLANVAGNAGEGQAYGFLSARCAQQKSCIYRPNQVWGKGGGGVVSARFASALPAGFEVRPNKSYFQQPWDSSGALMGSVAYGYSHAGTNTRGQWLNTKDRYLGLQFVIDGQVHYGWARLSVAPRRHNRSEIVAILTGYAYETVADKPIITGKTEGTDVTTLPPVNLESRTLGQLARGASQLPAWRRPKTQMKPKDNLH